MKNIVLIILLSFSMVQHIAADTIEGQEDTCTLNLNLTKGWNLVSLPCQPTDDSGNSTVAKIIIGSDDNEIKAYGNSWVVYEWNAISSKYRKLAINDTMKIGQGYWVYSPRDLFGIYVSDSNASTININTKINVVSNGAGSTWNLIGNISKDTSWYSNDGKKISWKEASKKKLVHAKVYVFRNGRYVTVDMTDPASIIEPREGVWVATLEKFNNNPLYLSATLQPLENIQKIKLPPQGSYYHGVYPGEAIGSGLEDDITIDDIRSYEKSVGDKKVAWVYFSHNWYPHTDEKTETQYKESRRFPMTTVKMIAKNGSIPFIRIMTRSDADNPRPDNRYSMDEINKGTYDDDFKAWARDAKAFGKPLLVEWGTEMNGQWFAWNGLYNHTSEDKKDGANKFKQAYRHIIGIMDDEHADNITWVFHANGGDDPDNNWNKFENYYPGNDFIDWIGVSLYGPQEPTEDYYNTPFKDLMDPIYERLNKLGNSKKPIMLLEFGATKGHNEVNQAQWTSSALGAILSDHWKNLKGFAWWNEKWKNSNNDISNMRVQDSEDLRNVMSDTFDSESDYIITRPI